MPHTHNLIPEAPQVGKTNLYLKWWIQEPELQ
jgi:hypothetical protein